MRIVLATNCCRFWSWGLVKKLNFCSDFEHKVWSRFWSWSSGKIWSWSLINFFLLMFCRGYVEPKLNLGRDSEARFGQDFEAIVLWRGWCLVEILKLMLGQNSEIWSRFVFELVIWTQPSGPLCLWQCLSISCIPDISEASSLCKLAKTKRWIRLLQKDIWQHHKRKDGRGAKARWWYQSAYYTQNVSLAIHLHLSTFSLICSPKNHERLTGGGFNPHSLGFAAFKKMRRLNQPDVGGDPAPPQVRNFCNKNGFCQKFLRLHMGFQSFHHQK